MSNANGNLKGTAVKAILVVCGLFVAATSFGCDMYGLGSFGLFDPSYLIGSTDAYRNDVMDWSAQAWSDVILYDDYIPYDVWDANDLTYPYY